MRTLRFDIVSIFPGMFESPFGDSIIERACEKGLLDIRVHDLRDYTLNKHRKVDDTPFGGGPGMVMRADVIDMAIEENKAQNPDRPLIYLSPRGRPLEQERVRELAAGPGITMLCGRYEGVDERLREIHEIQEISLGDPARQHEYLQSKVIKF